MIRFEDVSFTYQTHSGGVPALRGVSLTIEPGELLVVLGANGSGKSTLAQLANGLLVPESGTVTVDALATDDAEVIWQIRERVGIVFQDPENQIVATTVEEEVAFGPENLGLPRNELRARVDEALAAVELSQFALREPHQLSGGQKQRLAVAGVLAMRPRYVIMDEPASMLDGRGREEVARLARGLADAGHGVAVITHDLGVLGIADRVAVLDAGELALSGGPVDLLAVEPAQLDAWGLELPPLAVLAAELRGAGVPALAWPEGPEGLVASLCR